MEASSRITGRRMPISAPSRTAIKATTGSGRSTTTSMRRIRSMACWRPADTAGVGEDHPYINANMLNTFPITVWTTTENWIYTPNSSVVNEVRFGYDRMTIAQASLDAGLAFPVDTGLTTAAGWPNISIKGFNSFGTQHNRPQSFRTQPVFRLSGKSFVPEGKAQLQVRHRIRASRRRLEHS